MMNQAKNITARTAPRSLLSAACPRNPGISRGNKISGFRGQAAESRLLPDQLPKNKGFTMVEMLITLLILSILTIVVYPSYVAWIVKANRSDAMATLTQDQAILERCYAQTFAYNGTCASLPAFPQASTQGFYTINLSNLTATTYTLTATPTGSQVRDTICASMTIDQSGQKTAANSSGTSQTVCWNP